MHAHDGLDAVEPYGQHVDHMRAILVHAGVLPDRDTNIDRFELWVDGKLDGIDNPQITRPVRQLGLPRLWLTPDR